MIDPLVLPIVAMAIPIVIVPIALAFKYARFERELEHAERIKALEMGRTLPGDESWWSPVRLCAAIGAGVPVTCFTCVLIGSLAGMSGPDSREGWTAAGFVAVVAMLCGTFLLHRHLLQGPRAAHDDLHAKPAFDADEYDVVGSRG